MPKPTYPSLLWPAERKVPAPLKPAPILMWEGSDCLATGFTAVILFPPLWILNWSDLLTAQSWSVDFSAQAGVVLFVPTNNYTQKHHHRFDSKKLRQLHYSSTWAYLRIFNLLSYPTPSQNWPPVVRRPQLVCILCTLKTKPNGCHRRSASRANHCEYQPNQTSDSLFSIWIWHTTILYNSRRPMLR